MNCAEPIGGDRKSIKLANGADQPNTDFKTDLNNAALRLLGNAPDLIERSPELGRILGRFVASGKLKAPAGLSGRALEIEIDQAIDVARDRFRRRRARRKNGKSEEREAGDGASDAIYQGASAKDRALPFPEECIKGSCEEWIKTLEPRGEWPRPFLFAEWRMIHSMLIARSAWFGNGKPRFPQCHDLLIGDSGLTHKNTSINRAVSVIREVRPEVCFLSNLSSIEGALEALQHTHPPIGLIAAEEYSYLVAASRRQGCSLSAQVGQNGVIEEESILSSS